MTKRSKKKLISIIIGLISLLVAYQQRSAFEPLIQSAQQNQPGLYVVTEFVDGDTIRVDMNGSEETVRMLGIDTPETHDPRKSVQCFGQAASDFTKKFIGTSRVRLESDPDSTNRDRYDRLLRYVFLPDGRMVNIELLKQGYAFANTFFPLSRKEEFKTYQQQAEAASAGLWGSCEIEIKQNGQTQTQPI